MSTEPSEQDKSKAAEILDQLPVDYVGTGTSKDAGPAKRDAVEVIVAALAEVRGETWGKAIEGLTEFHRNHVCGVIGCVAGLEELKSLAAKDKDGR